MALRPGPVRKLLLTGRVPFAHAQVPSCEYRSEETKDNRLVPRFLSSVVVSTPYLVLYCVYAGVDARTPQ
jgi:hypothetical protein